MRLFVDDSEVDTGFLANQTLEEALRHVQANLCAPGHMVVGLRCDGETILSDAMAATLHEPATKFDRVDVITNTADALVSDALREASTVLDETTAGCEQAANLLVEGKTAEGISALGECLGGWQQIHDAVVKSIELLDIDPDQMTVRDEPFRDVIARPKQALIQIKESLESKDYVLLADILQYEFSEVTDMWHEMFDMLERRMADLREERP